MVIIFRMVERILGVLIGAVLIYFGYRLFLSLATKLGRDGGAGEFSFAGGNKIKLSKVGPDVFFALFGAGLLSTKVARDAAISRSGARDHELWRRGRIRAECVPSLSARKVGS
jgi:hypothetical protein